MSTSTGLEAAGQIIGECDGEHKTYTSRGRRTTATYVYRCLHLLNIKWGDYVSSDLGLARAIANNYNDVKHYDRGDYPAHKETYLVSAISRLLVRLLALHLTGKGESLLAPYREGNELWPIQQRFNGYATRISDDGRWELAG